MAANTAHIVFDEVNRQSPLPLIIKENDLDVLILDTTQIHIDAILNYMLA